jgi:hypothetical protein
MPVRPSPPAACALLGPHCPVRSLAMMTARFSRHASQA